MDRIVTRRILGESIIPKYNVRPPLTVTDSFDFFKQLENFGFTIEMVEEPKKEVKKETKVEKVVVEETPVEEVKEELTEVEAETPVEEVSDEIQEEVVGTEEVKEEIVKNKFNKKNKK